MGNHQPIYTLGGAHLNYDMHVQAQLLSKLLYIVKVIELRRGWAGIFSSNDSLAGAQLLRRQLYDGTIRVNKHAG